MQFFLYKMDSFNLNFTLHIVVSRRARCPSTKSCCTGNWSWEAWCWNSQPAETIEGGRAAIGSFPYFITFKHGLKLIPIQATAIFQAKQKLQSIAKANAKPVNSEELIKFAHRISASNAVCAPLNWQQGDLRRPYPTG